MFHIPDYYYYDNDTEQKTLTEKLTSAVQWTQESVHALGEKIGLLSSTQNQGDNSNFDNQIEKAADDMKSKINLDQLDKLEDKYDPGAKINSIAKSEGEKDSEIHSVRPVEDQIHPRKVTDDKIDSFEKNGSNKNAAVNIDTKEVDDGRIEGKNVEKNTTVLNSSLQDSVDTIAENIRRNVILVQKKADEAEEAVLNSMENSLNQSYEHKPLEYTDLSDPEFKFLHAQNPTVTIAPEKLFDTEEFKHEVVKVAAEYHPNMATLHKLDEKNQLDAEIHNVRPKNVMPTIEGTEKRHTVDVGGHKKISKSSKRAKRLFDTEEFKTDVVKGAAEYHPNMATLHKLDEKNQLDADIHTVKPNVPLEVTHQSKLKPVQELVKNRPDVVVTAPVFSVFTESVNTIPKKPFETEIFKKEVARGAAEFVPDLVALHRLDKKNEVVSLQVQQVEKQNPRTIPFNNAIERGASEMQTANTIERKKEDTNAVIDVGTEKLKSGVEAVANATIDAAHKAQDNINWTKDVVQENVDIVKEATEKQAESLKEKAKQNIGWATAKAGEKLSESIKRTQENVQEGAHILAEKIGLIPAPVTNFNQAISRGAADMHYNMDMDHLHQLDKKYELDAEINTVQRVDFGTNIERSAAKMHTASNIEGVKDNAFTFVDIGAATLKHAVEAVAEGTKIVALKAQENVHNTSDRTRLNVGLAKEEAHKNMDLVKEKFLDAVHKTQELMHDTMHELGEQIKSTTFAGGRTPESDFGTAIKEGASEMQRSLDMNTLHKLDEQRQLDAEISTVQKTNFNTAINRGAAKIQTARNLESIRDTFIHAIDVGADKLKSGVESAAQTTKAATHNTQETVYSAQDKAQENVEIAKDNAQRAKQMLREGTEILSEKITESVPVVKESLGFTTSHRTYSPFSAKPEIQGTSMEVKPVLVPVAKKVQVTQTTQPMFQVTKVSTSVHEVPQGITAEMTEEQKIKFVPENTLKHPQKVLPENQTPAGFGIINKST